MQEHEAIAAEIEIGRISLVGCTSYRDETNKVIMKILNGATPYNPDEARVIARRLCRCFENEKQALAGSQRVAQRFYEQLWRV